MLMRFARTLFLLAVAGVAYAGPLAACVCAAEPMDEMPCCPDDAQQHGQSPCTQPDEMNAPCDAVPADLLPVGTHDLSPPIAISSALPSLWFVRGPPLKSIASTPPPDGSSPIYLITGRLRI